MLRRGPGRHAGEDPLHGNHRLLHVVAPRARALILSGDGAREHLSGASWFDPLLSPLVSAGWEGRKLTSVSVILDIYTFRWVVGRITLTFTTMGGTRNSYGRFPCLVNVHQRDAIQTFCSNSN